MKHSSLHRCLLWLVVSVLAPSLKSAAPIVFDPDTGELNIKVNAGSYGLLKLSMMLKSDDPLTQQAQPDK